MNAGSTAWLLVSCALVLLMTPGLAFFYGGLVREGNVVNTIKMSFVALGVVAVEWALVGYSVAFDDGSPLLGGFRFLGLANVGMGADPAYAAQVPHLAFMAFQMMFAIITPALISGAVVGRMKFRAYVLFVLAWSILVYNPVAHWVWGPDGWIRALGALDFAGGTVVHVTAGISALAAALVLGPRRSSGGAESERPHNVPMVVLGASLLWFGWFGFNGGSAFAADGLAALALVNTMLAGAAAVMAWIGVDLWRTGRPTATGASIAAVVGLVTITPAAGFVRPLDALLMGAIGAGCSHVAVTSMRRTGLDDTLDVFACHGVGGIVGSLLTGIFATTTVNAAGADGLLHGNAALLGVQAVAVLAAATFAAVATAAIMIVLRAATAVRAPSFAVTSGLDVLEHAERAYAWEALRSLGRTGEMPVPDSVRSAG